MFKSCFISIFQSGMLISDQYNNESRHLDLGYPVTTVLGTKLYMDPNFFGVKIAVQDTNGLSRVISVADIDAKIDGMVRKKVSSDKFLLLLTWFGFGQKFFLKIV